MSEPRECDADILKETEQGLAPEDSMVIDGLTVSLLLWFQHLLLLYESVFLTLDVCA